MTIKITIYVIIIINDTFEQAMASRNSWESLAIRSRNPMIKHLLIWGVARPFISGRKEKSNQQIFRRNGALQPIILLFLIMNFLKIFFKVRMCLDWGVERDKEGRIQKFLIFGILFMRVIKRDLRGWTIYL